MQTVGGCEKKNRYGRNRGLQYESPSRTPPHPLPRPASSGLENSEILHPSQWIRELLVRSSVGIRRARLSLRNKISQRENAPSTHRSAVPLDSQEALRTVTCANPYYTRLYPSVHQSVHFNIEFKLLIICFRCTLRLVFCPPVTFFFGLLDLSLRFLRLPKSRTR